MRSLRDFVLAVAGLAAVAIALTLVVVRWPQLLVNDRTLGLGARLLERSGIEVTWKTAHVEVSSPGWLRKGVLLRFTGLCVRDARTGGYNACFDRAEVGGGASLSGFVPRVTTIGPVDLAGGKVDLDLARLSPGSRAVPPRKKGKPEPFNIADTIPGIFRGAAVEPIHLRIDRWTAREAGHALSGDFSLDETGGREGTSVSIRGAAREGRRARFGLRTDLRNPGGIWAWNRWRISLRASGDLADGNHLELNGDLAPRFVPSAHPELGAGQVLTLDYGLLGSSLKSGKLLVARLSGTANPERIDAVLQATGRNLSPVLPRVELDHCRLLAERSGPALSQGKFSLDCPVSSAVPVPPKKYAFFKLPARVGARLTVNVTSSSFIPGSSSRLQGAIKLQLRPVLTPFFQGDGDLSVKVAGRVSELSEREGALDATVNLKMAIPRFERLVEELDRTDWAVPAPLRVLRGRVFLRANGEASPATGFFPVRLRSRLASSTQALDLDLASTLEIDRARAGPRAKLGATLFLTDVKIELPRMDLGPDLVRPPRVLPDQRFVSFAKEKELEKHARKSSRLARALRRPAKLALDYDIAIRTRPGHPLRLITNLAKAPVPVDLDLLIRKDEPMSGTVKVERFPVEFFHRQAVIEHFDIALKAPMEDSEIDGLVRVPYTDIVILISLIGTTSKPRVVLNSEPPLPESDLTSALLFGEPPGQLDQGEGQTVGNTQTAISQGAIGLASLYLLASTPVQSVGYDPTTGQFTASFKIAQGTSLNVGAGSQETGQTVGIRKRLGSNWSIATDIEHANEPQLRVATALLQWTHRY